MVIYFIVSALILEAVTFHILKFSGGVEYFWYNFAIILFLAVLIYAIPNYTAQYVFYTIILITQVVFIYINYSLLMIYGDLFSIDMINLVWEAQAAMTSNFIYFSVMLQLFAVVIALILIGLLMLNECQKDKIEFKQHFSIYSVIILAMLEFFSCGFVFDRRNTINKMAEFGSVNYIESDAFLLNTSLLKASSYKKFGTYGYFLNIIVNQITNTNETIKRSTIDYFNSGNIYNSSSSDVFGVDEGNNVIVIMMESMEWFCFGNGNYDSNLNNLSNELTPNVYSLIYGEDNTKNTLDDSILATSFFAKSKTNISEGYGIMGNYPVGISFSDLVSKSNKKNTNAFGYSMPNKLKNLGYNTSYVHSNTLEFYDRESTHKALGFDNVVGKNTITKDGKLVYSAEDCWWEHWDNEENLVTNAMENIVPLDYQEKPFYSFYLNVSSHGEYSDNPNNKDIVRYKNYIMYGEDDCVLDENNNYIVDPNKQSQDLTYTEWYANVLNNYQATDSSLCNELLYFECGAVGLDRAIGKIVEKLKNSYYSDGTRLIDKTTICLYSDHYSYYNKLSNRVKGFPLTDFSSIKLNTIPMIISSPGLKKYNQVNNKNYTINDRFCSAYDLIPTLFDLLGCEFNENLYVGKSLFAPSQYTYKVDNGTEQGETRDMLIYYSNTGGLFNKDIYSFDMSEFYIENVNAKNDNNELVDAFHSEAKNILTKINYIGILNNYQLYDSLKDVN